MDYKKMASFEETGTTDELYIVALQDGENKRISADNLLADIQEQLDNIGDRICELEAPASGTFYQGQWTTGSSSAALVDSDGDEDVLDVWRPALVDCTDNSGEKTTLHELNRLNWLRYKGGSFAPAICITDDEYDECDQELYLSSGSKYCDAGEFDAESFYSDYGYNEKLYDSSGNEIGHIRRPWETTSTDYSHVIANKVPLYLVDQVESTEDSTYTNKVILRTDEESPFDGADYTEYKLPVTGLFASPFTTVDGKARSFFFDYSTGETNCNGGQGTNALCTLFYKDGTHPRTGDVSQCTSLTYCRANNSDTSVSYPFAEGGYLTHNIFCTCMELMAGTKYIIDPTNLWGSGISSDDSCSSESTWLANGGFRYKASSASSYSYCAIGSTPSIYTDANGSRVAATYLLSNRYPLAQCEEGQIAFSLMQELEIDEGNEFEWNGGTWWWQSVSGVPSVSDGHMNVRVYKKIEDTISAYDSSGNSCNYDIGIVLRFSLFEGLDLCGDIFGYCGGGLEMVGLGTGSGYTGRDETVDIWVQPDQKLWHNYSSTSYASTTSSTGFSFFQDSYTQIAEDLAIVGDHWAKDRTSYSPWSQTSGGSKSTYECFYIWQNPYWDSTSNGSGRYYRLSARFRGYARVSFCSPRALGAGNAVSSTDVNYGGFAQCLGKWE